MTEVKITVTVAAHNLAELANRANDEQQAFVLVQNGVPVARLVPVQRQVCRGSDLAAALSNAQLPEKDARDWNRDLQAARHSLKEPANKWQ